MVRYLYRINLLQDPPSSGSNTIPPRKNNYKGNPVSIPPDKMQENHWGKIDCRNLTHVTGRKLRHPGTLRSHPTSPQNFSKKNVRGPVQISVSAKLKQPNLTGPRNGLPSGDSRNPG